MIALSFICQISLALAETQLVSFIPPPGSKQVALGNRDQARIRRMIQDQLLALEELSDVPARPVRVQVFSTLEEYMTATQVPPDFGAVTQEDVIMMQPLSLLDHRQRLRRLLEHEAVHHHFYKVGKWWPRNFHEGLAHYLSGGRVAESPRAGILAAKRRSGAEELEFECHLAWLLHKQVRPLGKREFMRRLLRGEVDLSNFRRRANW